MSPDVHPALRASQSLSPATRLSAHYCSLIRLGIRAYPEHMEDAVSNLLDIIEADLRGATPVKLPVSGTLFQYVVSVVGRIEIPGNLDRFTIVPSRELSDFYGLRDIPRLFRFDGSAAPVGPPPQDEQQQPNTPRE